MAPKGSRNAVGNKGGGRPTLYQPIYAETAKKLCMLLGATDKQLAEFFNVDERTIGLWKVEHPKFYSAINEGKVIADAEVAHSLYQRAVGYEHDAVKIFMPAGAPSPVYAPFREKFPPETGAAKMWLSNRQKDRWREQIAMEHSGSINLGLASRLEQARKREGK